MFLSKMIAIGFLGSIFAMFRFSRFCRLLNSRDLEPEELERFQAGAQRWLAAAGVFFGMVVLSLLLGIIVQ